jgi:hypothetical protein
MKKEILLEALKNNVCTVTFTKVTGETRVMPCTLKEDIIPKSQHSGTKKPNDSIISVWCTDKSAWRSFRVENVLDLEISG